QAVVATSTLDLGVDWGDVDLVVQVGAPKGSGRLMQRIGRANHRLDEASRACLVPSNRFEYLECVGAYDAIMEGRVDPLTLEEGHLDVLAQHITGRACAAPFSREELAKEVRMAPPYAGISDKELEDVFQFVCHGGYALKAYEDLQRLAQVGEQWMIAAPRFRQRYRAQVGTIIDTPMTKVTPSRFVGGVWKPSAESIGDVEEWFAAGLRTGDAFVLGGRAWAVMGHDAERLLVVPAKGQAIAPSYQGGKFPLTTHLAERVRAMIASPQAERLDRQVIEWLSLQREKSVLPKADQMLVETFPRGDRYYLVAYPFDGRLAHQSLGMLLTRRLDRLGLVPMGFCANEYGLAIWLAQDAGQVDMDKLFAEDMLGDDLEEWFRDSAVVKRCFRYTAQIAGLTSKKPAGGQRGTALFSADLIFDVLMRHEPDHVLLRAAMRDAAGEVLDLARLQAALSRMKGAIIHKNLPRVSPLSVPIMLEVGREPIYSADQETLLDDLAGELMVEVGA
ncbi:MAG TPA: DNA ligase-associated DEXH box helicase, partial [Alphaproteobacteria bacterium]|nr:DNA ligase-associated DEXH box helicase [Alphaproteobacteria bacterium]